MWEPSYFHIFRISATKKISFLLQWLVLQTHLNVQNWGFSSKTPKIHKNPEHLTLLFCEMELRPTFQSLNVKFDHFFLLEKKSLQCFYTGNENYWAVDKLIVNLKKGENKISFEGDSRMWLDNINIIPFY